MKIKNGPEAQLFSLALSNATGFVGAIKEDDPKVAKIHAEHLCRLVKANEIIQGPRGLKDAIMDALYVHGIPFAAVEMVAGEAA